MHAGRHGCGRCSFNGATAFRPWKTFNAGRDMRSWTLASMGPRPFEPWKTAVNAKDGIRFVFTLQWGHGLSSRGRREHRRYHVTATIRFNGATAFRPWKTSGTAVDGACPSGFNGATAFRPWKTTIALQQRQSSHAIASMGPRPFEPWKTPTMPPHRPGLHWLQWGHGLSTVEDLDEYRAVGETKVLQWGHGLSTVEDSHGSTAKPSRLAASMGPRPFDRGRRSSSAIEAKKAWKASMGPRPFDRGRPPAFGDTLPTRFELQWGHGLSTVEDLPPRHNGPPLGYASMGPRPFDRGRPCSPVKRSIAASPASMGPRPFDRGRHRADSGRRSPQGASMGPRPFDLGRHQARLAQLHNSTVSVRSVAQTV